MQNGPSLEIIGTSTDPASRAACRMGVSAEFPADKCCGQKRRHALDSAHCAHTSSSATGARALCLPPSPGGARARGFFSLFTPSTVNCRLRGSFTLRTTDPCECRHNRDALVGLCMLSVRVPASESIDASKRALALRQHTCRQQGACRRSRTHSLDSLLRPVPEVAITMQLMP